MMGGRYHFTDCDGQVHDWRDDLPGRAVADPELDRPHAADANPGRPLRDSDLREFSEDEHRALDSLPLFLTIDGLEHQKTDRRLRRIDSGLAVVEYRAGSPDSDRRAWVGLHEGDRFVFPG